MALVQVQILNKVLQSKDYSIIENNMLSEDYFLGYEKEYQYIHDHYNEYGNVPDKETFLSHFTDFELLDVAESDKYLVDTIREIQLYRQLTPVIQKTSSLMQEDSSAAIEYWQSHMQELQPVYDFGGVDIIHESEERFNQFKERKENPDNCFFESGFKELDDITHGIQRGEELLVIIARTNQGKSWVLEKMVSHIWQTGFNVGYMSPEMGYNSIGFRFDTLFHNMSNRGLMRGSKDVDEDEYREYLEKLKESKNDFVVANPKHFGGDVTVSKLRQWVKQKKLDAIAIDGITYLSDERYRKGDSVTTSLTHISEDLMSLSVELGIPILIVAQLNRTGVKRDDDEGTPDLDSIRDSDGISFNASKVYAIRQKKDNVLEIGIKKQRFGAVGVSVCYQWNIDIGDFTYIEPDKSDSKPKKREKRPEDKSNMF